MKTIDVGPTVEAIRTMAQQHHETAAKLMELADQMETSGDLGLAAAAVNLAARQAQPLDWLVTRPLQALAAAAE